MLKVSSKTSIGALGEFHSLTRDPADTMCPLMLPIEVLDETFSIFVTYSSRGFI